MSQSTSLVSFASLQNDTSATTDLNTNFSAINTALTGCLSLLGQAPNQMQAVLDMNSNQIINLPAPVSNFSPVRLLDINSLATGGTITVNPLPTGGTAGQVLTKNSSTNFDASWLTPAVAVTPGKSVSILNSLTFSGVDASILTFQGTDTYVGRATTDTLTNKTFNAGFTGNVLQILGNQVTGVSGTGGLVLMQASPTINGPQLTGTISGTPTFSGLNFISLTNIAQQPAYTFVGNTTGVTGNLSAFTPGSLTQKTTSLSSDLVVISDQSAGGQLKFATVANVGSSAGVSSLGGSTGAITLQSPGLTMSANNLVNTSVPHMKTSTFVTDANSTTSTVYYFRAVGAGGGGGGANGAGSAGGGGGAGAYIEGTFSGVAPGATVTITLGSGGTAGANTGGSGGNGGTTTIAATGITTLQAGGGLGGGGVTSGQGTAGVGGTVGTGSPTIGITGSNGEPGQSVSGTFFKGGSGAASFFGAGGYTTLGTSSSFSGNTPNAPGAGGSGGGAIGVGGGAGAPGHCMIMYWL